MSYGLRPGARRGIDLGTRRGLSVGDLAQAMPPGTVAPPKQQQEQIGAQAREMATGDAEALALADVLGADAFRPTEAPGALTGIARVVELLTQHRGNLRERQEAQGAERTEEKRDLARRQALTEAVRAYSATGDANALVSALADADPEQGLDLATTLAGREAPERWSDPYEMSGAMVQRNERTNQVRPAVTPNATTIYQPPSGYRGSPDSLEAIPGGPADLRATAEGRSRSQALESSARQLGNAINVLNDLSTIQNDAAGFTGGALRGVAGTSAYDLNQALEPVRAILSFESLAEMRRNSTTGGALGSIAVRELELLGNTVRSLDTAQSPRQLANNIRETRAQLQRTLNAVQAAQSEVGASEEAAPQSGTTRMRWNPETGQLEPVQ